MKKTIINIIALLGIISIGCIVYLPAFSAPFVIDDYGLVVRNTVIRSLHNVPAFFGGGTFYGGNNVKLVGSFYRPLTVLYYAIIYHFFGLSSFHYHFFFIIFHFINTFLVYSVLKTFIKHKLLPYLLALVFLVHPMQVETVTYISTHDILPFMFGVLAFIAVLHNSTFIIPLALLAIALLFKESAILFFAFIIIYTYLFRRHKTLIYTILLVILFVCYSLVRCKIGHICTSAGDNSALTNAPIVSYLINLPSIIFFYFKTFFYPAVLAHGQHWFIKKITVDDFYIPLFGMFVVFVSLFAGLLFMYARHYKNKAINAPHKTYVFFLLWLVCGLLMYMHFLPVDFTVADHWFYLPMVGLIGLIGVIINDLEKTKKIIYLILAISVIILGIRTYYRNIDWQDQYRLLLKDYPHSPQSYDIENNIGYELSHRGKIKESIIYFKKATESAPTYPIGWHNLGISYENIGNYETALKYYKIAQKGQGFYPAYERYAILLIHLHRNEEARTFLQKQAIPKFPYNPKFKELLKQADTVTPQQ